ncbi:hypothetical protein BR93DRAFT_982439 [Coniochaeta sp. PMI_546]|nr:hypothetical protein BR93DRAFT_982439 [Coniochaeta sp. PMI_546]
MSQQRRSTTNLMTTAARKRLTSFGDESEPAVATSKLTSPFNMPGDRMRQCRPSTPPKSKLWAQPTLPKTLRYARRKLAPLHRTRRAKPTLVFPAPTSGPAGVQDEENKTDIRHKTSWQHHVAIKHHSHTPSELIDESPATPPVVSLSTPAVPRLPQARHQAGSILAETSDRSHVVTLSPTRPHQAWTLSKSDDDEDASVPTKRRFRENSNGLADVNERLRGRLRTLVAENEYLEQENDRLRAHIRKARQSLLL